MCSKMLKKLNEFIRLESAGGIVLLAAAVLALVLSNSSWAPIYHHIVGAQLTITFNHIGLSKPLVLWVNEGLMAIFFCLVSLEIKREIKTGALSSTAQRILPSIAAVGGMIVPAAIFYICVRPLGAQALEGWAIPTATDIAFSLGVISLLGRRIPIELKVLLAAIAIFDDLAGILIIAIYYTDAISWWMLLGALLCGATLGALRYCQVRVLGPYLLIGFLLWLCVLKSGVHATLAGVVLAIALPLKIPGPSLAEQVERRLHPWVAFGVMPLFALANAGVDLSQMHWDVLWMPVPLGIILGLFLGKQMGIFSAIWLADCLGIARRPEGISWSGIWGVSLLCGIGFTMSLFLGTLAYDDPNSIMQHWVRVGVFAGSIISGVLGALVLKYLPVRRA